jgi:hypothetical protein
MQVTLDHPAVVIGGLDESLPGGAQLRDLGAQALECFPRRFVVPNLQGDRPPDL